MIVDLALRIENELTKITGWCPPAKAIDLATLVYSLRPDVIVELGVWGGRSLIPMTLTCAALQRGHLIAIDPWNPIESQKGYTGQNEEWWGKQDHELVYQQFIRHLDRLGLSDRVTVIRSPSDDVDPPECDVLHVDGQHAAQAIRDVERFAPKVRVGGVVVLDDLTWHNDGVAHVAMAVERLKALGFIELYRNSNGSVEWGMFQKVK